MYNKPYTNLPMRSLSELEFEKLLRRAEQRIKPGRPELLKKDLHLKRAANS